MALVLLEAFDAVFVVRIDAEGVGEPGGQPFLLCGTIRQFVAMPGQCMGLFQRVLELRIARVHWVVRLPEILE
ncbi:hypothetical protein, partial [Xanthomonas axonopodis]|uniref:hypothetical protein n=1 Tax=Xanthomonas axonopodis TaxID=53413 RepID=UPI001CA540B5